MNAMLISIGLLIGADAPTQTWPSFRGDGTGQTSAKNVPTEWSESTGQAWKYDLPGYGQSAPIVWKDTVYVTAVSGDMRDKGHVLAIDAQTGKQKWKYELEPTQKVKMSFSVSRAAPTPCADADGVYCLFEGGNVVALTHEGKMRWDLSLVKEYGEFKGGHGIGGSPCQSKDEVFILIDHAGPSYILALEKKTGKVKWKTDREGKMSWSSPLFVNFKGKDLLIVSSNGTVIAYTANDGKELWKIDGFSGNTIPSASILGSQVLIGAGSMRGKEPEKAAKSNCCIQLSEKDGKPDFTIQWNAKAGIANYMTPLAYEGYAYFVNSVGLLYCYDLKTGKECYAERIDSTCWASPIGAEGKVYFFGRNGVTTVIKSGEKFEKVASNPLWKNEEKPKGKEEPKGGFGEYGDPILYGAAITEGAIYLRSGNALYKVGKK